MVETFTWHNGSECLDWKWLSLNKNELISSFFVRNAMAHGVSPIELVNLLSSRHHPLYQDIDKSHSGCLQHALQKILVAYRPKKYELNRFINLACSDSRMAKSSLISDIGLRARFAQRGLRVCPDCLQDGQCIFTYENRCIWNLFCKRHNNSTIDVCPNCKAPIDFLRVARPVKTLARCFNCDHTLHSKNENNRFVESSEYWQSGFVSVLGKNQTNETLRWYAFVNKNLELARILSRSTLLLQQLGCPEMKSYFIQSNQHCTSSLESKSSDFIAGLFYLGFKLKDLKIHDLKLLFANSGICYSRASKRLGLALSILGESELLCRRTKSSHQRKNSPPLTRPKHEIIEMHKALELDIARTMRIRSLK